MTDAERQRNRRQRQLDSCDNDAEREALQKARREQYKLENEKVDKGGIMYGQRRCDTWEHAAHAFESDGIGTEEIGAYEEKERSREVGKVDYETCQR